MPDMSADTRELRVSLIETARDRDAWRSTAKRWQEVCEKLIMGTDRLGGILTDMEELSTATYADLALGEATLLRAGRL